MANSHLLDAPRPAGYAALVQMLGLQVISNWHESVVAANGTQGVAFSGGAVRATYTAKYWPGETLGDHLEFALKYDGVNLAMLASIFAAASPDDVTAYVQSQPTGKYARRVWYLYEWITGKRLAIDDIQRGNYVDLLEPDLYVTSSPGRRIRRQRINDNMLGNAQFCPTVRRTEAVNRWLNTDLRQRCQQVLGNYPPELLKRALSYLYTQETKSSFAIESIQPDASRTERFIALLELAEKEDFCAKPRLIDLQNRTVDPRFADADYRTSQNYVGETVALQTQRVHYVCPKPEDLPELMNGLLEAHRQMEEGGVHPVVHAAAVSYGFVFLHPFEDGNGRIHRFLIHNILARFRYTPEGLMFPVSAVMLKNPRDYEASLQAHSRPLMSLAQFTLDDQGRMTVHNDTALWYRFIDMTPQVQALFAFIEKTINTELAEELSFLVNHDRARSALQDIVDMPDRQIDLFIRLCLQNQGRLSQSKRASQFAALSDDEVARMERAVREAYGQDR